MHVVILAGEPSGDMHAARLVQALRKRLPEVRFSGTGGPAMERAGVDLILRLPQLNFMGFVEILKHLGRIRKNFRIVKNHLLNTRPDLVILVDYPGFNLRMARWAKGHGFSCIYYIAPQVWAWKEGRVSILKECCQQILCILPFEEPYFRDKGVNAAYVGHPLMEDLAEIPPRDTRSYLSLFPGSRRFEIINHLPIMLRAACILGEKEVLLARPTDMPEDYYVAASATADIKIRFVSASEALAKARYAFVKSGTSSLQAALWQVPHVVCYRGHWLSYRIAKKLVKVPFISLVNLIAGREIVKELLQHNLTAERLAAEGQKLRDDNSYRFGMREGFKLVRDRLGDGNASEKAADKIVRLLRPQ
jgi:lipid-A-disaccharide synthase